MARGAYLTIDDSPSTRSDDLVDFLEERDVPAIFFCRGDRLENNATSMVRAVERGMVIGNHAYSHQRYSEISYEEMVEEIQKTDAIIDNIYGMANVERPGKYFRFPHLDRGCGSQVVNYEAFDPLEKKSVLAAFTEGLNVIKFDSITDEQKEKRDKLQNFLKQSGFVSPFTRVTHDWYQHEEVQSAHDCLFTFSTCDWMLTKRHEGRWRFKTTEDLKSKITYDKNLNANKSVSVVLVHDQAEIMDITIELIEFMLECKFSFLPIAEEVASEGNTVNA